MAGLNRCEAPAEAVELLAVAPLVARMELNDLQRLAYGDGACC